MGNDQFYCAIKLNRYITLSFIQVKKKKKKTRVVTSEQRRAVQGVSLLKYKKLSYSEKVVSAQALSQICPIGDEAN